MLHSNQVLRFRVSLALRQCYTEGRSDWKQLEAVCVCDHCLHSTTSREGKEKSPGLAGEVNLLVGIYRDACEEEVLTIQLSNSAMPPSL